MTFSEEKTTENILSSGAVTMERTVFFVCLCVAVEGEIGKHVFIDETLKWPQAQDYCRRHHTDLLYFNSQSEIDELLRAAGGLLRRGWIGLYQDPNNRTAWMWSGGGHATFLNWWYLGEPDSGGNGEYGVMASNGKWMDLPNMFPLNFYCVDVTVVEEEESWEVALSRCREKRSHLPSLISETDRLLARTQIQDQGVDGPVWIGLRFLGDRWMWVNGDPLEYEAWSQESGQDHQCPVRKRCGALSKEGLWENRDCGDQLHFICV